MQNYTHDLENPELDQMIGRFDPGRGRFGIIMCRNVKDKKTTIARCQDAFKSQQGAIVILTDKDITDALEAGPLGRESRLNEIIQSKVRELLS